MKKYLLLLLLLGGRPALASQIVVGLRSDNLISWGVWQREGSTLQHYLLLYNKSAQSLAVTIREKRFQAVGTNFTDGTTHKRLFSSTLAPGQWVRVRYPKSRAKSAYLEYFERNVSVGLLPLNTSRPDAAALAGAAYRFYTNEAANASGLRYWLAFNALDTPPAHLRLTAAADEFSHSSPRRGEEAYGLVRLYAAAAAPRQPGTLDSLFATGQGLGIARLDSAHRTVLMPVEAPAPTSQPTMLVLLTENVDKYFRYNEQRQLVPGKSVSGTLYFLPFFPARPN
ncbi:MAG: hypothetical protein ACRYF0_02165 [Janthinobacterium lividum]